MVIQYILYWLLLLNFNIAMFFHTTQTIKFRNFLNFTAFSGGMEKL